MARKLFKEINTTEPHPQKYSVLGSQMGINADFNSYIQGYINAAKIAYERYKMADTAEIDVLDTLVYPICFLYRQITELYIKHIYIKYSTEDENGKSDFVKRVSHKLKLAWEKTTPILEKLKERFPSFSVSIEECGELIKQIDEFDTTSMRMRYPITKDFRATNEKPMLLDIDNLNEGMNELFEKLQKICDFFSNVLADNTVDSAFEIKVLEKAPSCSNIMIDMAKKIEEVQAQESVLPKKRDTDILGLLNLADIEPQDGDTVERAIASIIREADVEEIKYIMMCFHTGCDLKNRGLKLSEKIDERKKDLICAFEATEAECNVLIKSNDKWEITEQLCSVRSEYALSVLNLILKEMHDTQIIQ